MNNFISAKLREYTAELRKMSAEGASEEALNGYKDAALSQMFGFLCMNMGCPPETFDFEAVDKKKKFVCDRGLTPKSFFDKYIGSYIDDYVSVINAPTPGKPFDKTYTVRYLGNVVEGASIKYLNVNLKDFKELARKQMLAGELIWFGSDCGKCGDNKTGIWDCDLYDYARSTGIPINLDKSQMLDYRQSAMNHAMVLTGANFIDDSTVTRWKIENSWGDKDANKGYFVCSDRWFDAYVYQLVINKKYLSAQMLEALKAEPITLQPWDPMGTLAICG
jgi:bleomycin hydrolase